MKEIVIISGKGGTGKTSLVSALAAQLSNLVLADCDVDAANLEILLQPEIIQTNDFISGVEAKMDRSLCTDCGACVNLCRFDAIKPQKDGSFAIEETSCEGCKVCAQFCPKGAIQMQPRNCGVWMKSKTKYGPFVHAALHSAAENSGKLVSTVRQEARQWAEKEKKEILLVDGPPGIGCPVIASITGADLLIILTEPTLSGLHDMKRAYDLAGHFKIPVALCLNKWDINPEISDEIVSFAKETKAPFLGKIPYDEGLARALSFKKNALEANGPSAAAFKEIGQQLKTLIDQSEGSEK